eukprot:529293_1
MATVVKICWPMLFTMITLCFTYEERFGSIADSHTMDNTILFFDSMGTVDAWNFTTHNQSVGSSVSIPTDTNICPDPTKQCTVLDCKVGDLCELSLYSNLLVPTDTQIWMQYSLKFIKYSESNYTKINVRYHSATSDYYVGNIYHANHPYNWIMNEPSSPTNNKTTNLKTSVWGEGFAKKIFIDIFGLSSNSWDGDHWFKGLRESVKISIQDIYIFEPSPIPIRLNRNTSNGMTYNGGTTISGTVEVFFDNRWGAIIGSIDTSYLNQQFECDSITVYHGVSGLFPNTPDLVWIENMRTSPAGCSVNGPIYCYFWYDGGWGVTSNQSVKSLPYINILCYGIPTPAPTPNPTVELLTNECNYIQKRSANGGNYELYPLDACLSTLRCCPSRYVSDKYSCINGTAYRTRYNTPNCTGEVDTFYPLGTKSSYIPYHGTQCNQALSCDYVTYEWVSLYGRGHSAKVTNLCYDSRGSTDDRSLREWSMHLCYNGNVLEVDFGLSNGDCTGNHDIKTVINANWAQYNVTRCTNPNILPTPLPSPSPTSEPTVEPTGNPSPYPTEIHTVDPTIDPTSEPTSPPLPIPSLRCGQFIVDMYYASNVSLCFGDDYPIQPICIGTHLYWNYYTNGSYSECLNGNLAYVFQQVSHVMFEYKASITNYLCCDTTPGYHRITYQPTVAIPNSPTPRKPTLAQTTSRPTTPTLFPTNAPTKITISPSVLTGQPTKNPTLEPTSSPSFEPTVEPTHHPTLEPTQFTHPPTANPTLIPTIFPFDISTSTGVMSTSEIKDQDAEDIAKYRSILVTLILYVIVLWV